MHYYTAISDYCKAISIPAPAHEHYDIRRFEENMATVVHEMPAFRHAFYAIAIKVNGSGMAVTGHNLDFPDGAAVFFNSPFQVLSWDIAPDWEGYYVMFTQDFISQTPIFDQFLHRFPFLKLDTSIPFQVGAEEVRTLVDLFDEIYSLYHGIQDDKFEFIKTYTLLLLNYVMRYYTQQVTAEKSDKILRHADIKLTSRYRTLIEEAFRSEEDSHDGQTHTTSYYADILHVHPNHLNAMVKSITGNTAKSMIREHLLHLAKTRLAQTDISIKELAYSLHFSTPNRFSSFFKKQTGMTPGDFRQGGLL